MGYTVGNNTVIDDTQNVSANGFSYTSLYLVGAYQGQNFGYIFGNDPPANTGDSAISRWPFASSTTNATSVGNLTVLLKVGAGHSSDVNGYKSGGSGKVASNEQPAGPPVANSNIDKWPFASGTTNATNIGNISSTRWVNGGTSTINYGYGYNFGGYAGPGQNPTQLFSTIDRFPFAASTTNATAVANLYFKTFYDSGATSSDYGYRVGGTSYSNPPAQPGTYSGFERWPYASSSSSGVSVGNNPLQATQRPAAASSQDYAYHAGSFSAPATYSLAISRIPFALSTVNSVSVGNLITSRGYSTTGASSTTHGYCSGGQTAPGASVSAIERWPFASGTTNSASVGNLLATTNSASDAQY